MNNSILADLLFPNVLETPDDMEKKYPERNLPEGAYVTRIPPSPTGYMHMGGLFGAIADERLAHTHNGVFYLRIEDTDDKREMPGAVENIIEVCEYFGLKFDEGVMLNSDIGNYGPYRQSYRKNIYQVFAKELVRKERAYPCFCTTEELSNQHDIQEANKENYGYYGKYAVHRDMPFDEIIKLLNEGKPYVLRFKSMGTPDKIVHFKDEIKGKIQFPENNDDFVLLKSDGMPTYHFAHAVDDHLMRTTHVVRGEEWLSTLPWHYELFNALEFKLPKYCHTAQVLKLDNGNKRKLSKRKDPEAALDFYVTEGYPALSVVEYIMSLLNSNFEEWRRANKTLPYKDFDFTTQKMSVSGCLFDLDKLNDVSKNTISFMDAETVYNLTINWAKNYHSKLYDLIKDQKEYTIKILSIGRGGEKPRKDLTAFRDVFEYISFFFDSSFKPDYSLFSSFDKEDLIKILTDYQSIYNEQDEQNVWFEKIKELSSKNGFCPDTKEYKKNPESYKGHVGDVSMILRIAITGKQNSPDMYLVMKLLGKEKTINRLINAINSIN